MVKSKKKYIFMVILTLLTILFSPLLHNVHASVRANEAPSVSADVNQITLATSYPAWDRSKVYVNGDLVTYNGQDYKAKWWTLGEVPGVAIVWEKVTIITPIPLSNGVYSITNKVSGKVLDITDNSMANGAKTQQWTNNNTTNQQFKVEIQEDGYYKITAMHSGLALDVPNIR